MKPYIMRLNSEQKEKMSIELQNLKKDRILGCPFNLIHKICEAIFPELLDINNPRGWCPCNLLEEGHISKDDFINRVELAISNGYVEIKERED